MKLRNLLLSSIVLLAACSTHEREGALTVSKVVLPSIDPTSGTCSLDPASIESIYPNFDPARPGNNALVGFVVVNQISDPTTINTVLRTDTANFNPEVAHVTYAVEGAKGTLDAEDIAVSGVTVPNGGSGSIAVPLFAPAAVVAKLPANGYVITSTWIEGKLDDGSTASTSTRDFIVHVCSGCTVPACF